MNDRDCENCKHHTEKGCDSWDCEFERRMARKEIIEMLKVLKEQALKSHNDTAIIDVKKNSFIYVMNVAINSLEIDERYELEYENAEEIHREKEQAYMQGYEDASKKYRQEPKTGHWEWVQYDYNPKLGNWHCSECRCIVVECVGKEDKGGIPLYKYCPQCGIKMKSQESEDKCKNCKYYSNPDYERCHKCKAESEEVNDTDI